MWINTPNPMLPPHPHVPVPPREVFWVLFKHGFMRWMPDDLLAPLLLAAIPGLLFIVLTYFATREKPDDQPLQGG